MPETANMLDVAFAIPGDLMLQTGGYAYDRRVLDLLQGDSIDITHMPLPRAFPKPSGMDLCTTAQVIAALPKTTVVLVDGLAYGAFSVGTLAAIPNRIVALVHHPLAFETGISAERAAALLLSETTALARANHVVVTSPMTAALLQTNLAVPAEKITVAIPGTDPATRATGTGQPLQLLAVGSVVPRKGYTVLIDALRALERRDWHLTIAGAARDSQELALVEGAIAASDLGDHITLVGAIDDADLGRLYSAADLFVMPSLFEGYGMVLAEAMARGLPIDCTTGGAAAETVPDEAAIKVPPGDAAAFSAALAKVMSDTSLRQNLSDASWAAGQTLPRWTDTARIIAGVLKDGAR